MNIKFESFVSHINQMQDVLFYTPDNQDYGILIYTVNFE